MNARSASWFFWVLAALHVALVVYLLRDVGIALDEWTWLLYLTGRFEHFSSWQTLVAPYNHQPIIGELLIYRGWAATVGPGAHWLLDLFFATVQAATAGGLYWLLQRRTSPWLALGASALVLFEGRAWESLLFPASLTFILPAAVVCLMCCVLDLERIPRPAWGFTAGALAFAVVSGGLGIALVAGGLVETALQRSWQRALMLAPAAASLVWWYSFEWSSRGLSASANLHAAPWWMVRFIVAAAGACCDLPGAGGVGVLVVAAGLIWWLRQRTEETGPIWSPRLAGLTCTLLVAAASTAGARAATTPAAESRYMYFPAIVLMLIAVELLRGIRIPGRGCSSCR